MDTVTNYWNLITEMVIEYTPKILLALLVLIIGFWLISRIVKLLVRGLDNSNLTVELRKFFASILGVTLKIILLFSVVQILGVKTMSFVAIMGAATLAIGMALQGNIGNFASGVMVMVFRPYKIGDVVEIAGVVGEVSDIQIFNTILVTPTNKTIIIPNGIATSDKIINYTTVGSIRVDTFFNVGYDEDLEKIQEIIMKEVIAKNGDVLHDMPNSVSVQSYKDHALEVGAFIFTTPDKYWKVFYEVRNEIKRALGASGIKAAYPIGIASGEINSK